MKKTKILSLVSLGAFLLTTSGCTDYDFDSKYEDPSKVTQVTISNLMVGVFQKVRTMMFTNTTGSSDSIHSLQASMHKPSATPTLQICIPRLYTRH